MQRWSHRSPGRLAALRDAQVKVGVEARPPTGVLLSALEAALA
jgi:hypothetical protein